MVVVAFAMAGVTASVAQADSETEQESTGYSIVQGDECIDIEPLGSGVQTVEDFYDYRTPETDPVGYTYSSHGTTHLQEANTSIIFLYQGHDGLGLVLVHGALDADSAGGMVSMEISGLPAEGEWVVEDDNYSDDLEGGPDDIFVHEETESRIAWVYSENRTDGAAFSGGLEDGFEIRIVPQFNEVVEFSPDEHDVDPNIEDWQVISAAPGGYDRTSLDMESPMTIQSSPCASYRVTGVTATGETTTDGTAVIEATVANDGAQTETIPVTFTVDGEPIDEQEVTLDPGEETTVTTSTTFDEAGTYTVGVGGETTEIAVNEDGWMLPIDELSLPDVTDRSVSVLAGIGAVGAVTLVGVVLLARRRTR